LIALILIHVEPDQEPAHVPVQLPPLTVATTVSLAPVLTVVFFV
jgi:hypothetical protein